MDCWVAGLARLAGRSALLLGFASFQQFVGRRLEPCSPTRSTLGEVGGFFMPHELARPFVMFSVLVFCRPSPAVRLPACSLAFAPSFCLPPPRLALPAPPPWLPLVLVSAGLFFIAHWTKISREQSALVQKIGLVPGCLHFEDSC